jgi:serine/threonine protein kinase
VAGIRSSEEALDAEVPQAYLHELIIWRCLRHPNIVPLIGTSLQFPVSLVSEWMTGGTITAFLRGYPNWERSFLVSCCVLARSRSECCCSQVIDILQGLGFMHSLDVVHGDLKPVCTGDCSLPAQFPTRDRRRMSWSTPRVERDSPTLGWPSP